VQLPKPGESTKVFLPKHLLPFSITELVGLASQLFTIGLDCAVHIGGLDLGQNRQLELVALFFLPTVRETLATVFST